MIEITRRLEFDAGHRVCGHAGKCNSLHGHRYTLLVTVVADELDELGMVIDFGVIKELLGGWLEHYWDHAMILSTDDPVISLYHNDGPLREHKYYPLPYNPTAENMARYIATIIWPSLGLTQLRLQQVCVFETPNCYAVWKADG